MTTCQWCGPRIFWCPLLAESSLLFQRFAEKLTAAMRPKADIAQLWQKVLQFSPIGNVGCNFMPARYAQPDL